MPESVVEPVPPLPTASVPVTPVVSGSPVAFVRVAALGVPRFGVVRLGEVAKTSAPLPVSSVTAVARFAEDGVPRKSAIPAASPETSVAIETKPVVTAPAVARSTPESEPTESEPKNPAVEEA